MLEPERELRAATRHRARTKATYDAADERFRDAIRDARAAKIPQARVTEITGLTRMRINQIVRNSRV